MSRIKDTIAASTFTQTQHSTPPPSLLPSTNPFTTPLTVLIIGASKGIGAGIARAYAQARASTLILTARESSQKELTSIAYDISLLSPTTSVIQYAVDITSSSSVSALYDRICAEVKRVDVIVFNAGYSGPVILNVHEGKTQDFQEVFNVNVQGAYLIAHYFIPVLRKSSHATFIAVGSFAGLITSGHIANTAYCISKFAQARLVEFLAEQYGRVGVDAENEKEVLAVSVHPGAVLTEIADQTTPESFRKYLTDDVDLCGAFCVWLTREMRMEFNGRLLSAKWDVDELMAQKEKIVEQDLLKFGLRT